MNSRQITILAFYKSPLTVDFSNKVVLKVGVRCQRPACCRVASCLHTYSQDLTIRGIYGRRIWDTWKLTTQLLSDGMDVSPVITHRFNGGTSCSSYLLRGARW